MKILVIIGGILLAGFVGIQLFALKSQYNIETYPYMVVEEFDSFEIRHYEARLFSAVKISSGDYKSASGQGFLFWQDTFLAVMTETKKLP